MKKQITVACRKRDIKCFTVQKYSNDESWNVEGGTAPSGVHATRYLRRTSPDLDKLTPLARFLFENCPKCVFGNYPAFELLDRVQVFNGKSEGDVLYDLDNKPAKINDWHFDIIEPDQTDVDYWNMTAGRILAVGATVVQVGGQKWEVA